ncbi:hypothetical protein [Streptomyces sp. STR69]|uniref:hypothetical protein n=1 Tax=Streptomyces sp. STR69 TaxID=1796942 RepID=UPI003966D703
MRELDEALAVHPDRSLGFGSVPLGRPDPMWWDHMGRITISTLVIAGGPTSGIPQDHENRPEEFLAAVEPFLAERSDVRTATVTSRTSS